MAIARSRQRHSHLQWDAAVDDFFLEKRRANISQATVDVYTMCLRGPRTGPGWTSSG